MTDRGSAASEVRLGSRKLAVVGGDITTIAADAIVNAANESLLGGGGVDGAIHRLGGPSIMTELEERYGRRRRCPTGSAVITGAGRLPARWVIHAVGPVWRGGGHGERDLLASAYRASFGLAVDAGARTVTLPAISCGVYGYPIAEGARVALETAATVLDDPSTTVERATFVLFSGDTLTVFAGILAQIAAARRA